MKKILIPTDFSENAWNTILYGMHLYNHSACEFHLLHVYDLSVIEYITHTSSHKIGHLLESVKIESEQGLKAIVDRIGKTNKTNKHFYKTYAKPFDFIASVKELYESEQYDLILIGTKGATGAKEVFMGTNTYRLVKNIDECPILIIPEKADFYTLKKIGFATDLEKIFYKSELNPIRELLKLFQAEINLFHFNKASKLSGKQHHNLGEFRAYLDIHNFQFIVFRGFDQIQEGIQKGIKDYDIDLLALIKYPNNLFHRLIQPSVIKNLTFHIEIPLLIIPFDTE